MNLRNGNPDCRVAGSSPQLAGCQASVGALRPQLFIFSLERVGFGRPPRGGPGVCLWTSVKSHRGH